MKNLSIILFLLLLATILIVKLFISHKKQSIKSYFATLDVINKVIKLIFRYNYLYIFISIIYSILQGILPIISMLLIQRLINAIQINTFEQKSFIIMIFIYITIESLQILISEIYNLYSTNFIKKFSKYIEVKMINKANSLSIKDYENNTTYDLINRAQVQNGGTVINYFNSFISVLQQLITIGSATIIIALYKIWILLIVIIAPIIEFYFAQKIGKEQYRISVNRTSEERKCWYINYLMLLGNAKKETIIFDIGNYFIKQYSDLKDKFIKQDYRIMKKAFGINIIVIIISQLFSIIVYMNILLNGFWGKLFIGNVTTYISCVSTVKNGVEIVLNQITSIYKESLYINLLFDFLNLVVTKEDEGEKIKINEIKSIELKNIYYKFKQNSEYTLKDINLKITNTDVVSIVGRNGSGKSTLIKIILGLYDDYEGEILINGVNLNKIDKHSYYKRLSCVFQDYNKYEASIRENVGYGNIDELHNDSLIKESLKCSGINNELSINEDLDTILGYWFGEKELSGGQWQKVAISRAIIRNADLYILDEPDSALDAITEKDILKNYKEILQYKMGIFVSHNVNHINLLCNKIFVIDNGEIIESGTHDKLIECNGLYSQLYLNYNLEDLLTN